VGPSNSPPYYLPTPRSPLTAPSWASSSPTSTSLREEFFRLYNTLLSPLIITDHHLCAACPTASLSARHHHVTTVTDEASAVATLAPSSAVPLSPHLHEQNRHLPCPSPHCPSLQYPCTRWKSWIQATPRISVWSMTYFKKVFLFSEGPFSNVWIQKPN
jgi:hypothetical protein